MLSSTPFPASFFHVPMPLSLNLYIELKVLRSRKYFLRYKPIPYRVNVLASKILYWVGCTTRYLVPELSSSMTNLLKKAGIEYFILNDEICCGYPLVLTGDLNAFAENVRRVINMVKELDLDLVVSNCPGCYRCFTEFYPQVLGYTPFKVMHSTRLINDLLRSGRLRIARRFELLVTYHDPCDLGRHSGIYDLPRQIINSVPGIKLVEMERSLDAARCCGSGGALRLLIPQLSTQISVTRIKDDVSPLNVNALITACPTCVKGLRDGVSIAHLMYGIKPIEVLDIVQLIDMVTEA